MKKGIDYIGVGAGAMIFNEDGKVFMNKRGKEVRNEAGKWEFPGGGVDFGERCEDTVVREVKEEFDFDIEVVELLEVVNHIIPDEKQHWVSPSFIAKYVDGKPKIMESHKCTEIKWVKLEEVNSEELSIASLSNFNKYKEKFGFKSPYF